MRKIQIAKPHIDAKDVKAVSDVVKSGWLSLGPKYKEFEEAVKIYTGAKYALAVSSGTAGLHLAMLVLEIGEGDEVITTPYSFIASSNCIMFTGAKPVFVDIDESTFNIQADAIERAISKKTKAILPVHVFGQTADIKKIISIAKKHNLKIIEDSCESLGAFNGKKMTGTFGDIGVYSFYPNKQITTGEGAVIVTNNKKYADLMDSLRNQGRGLKVTGKSKKWNWLTSERLGYNYRMDEMSAALGVAQISKIDRMIEYRRHIVDWYQKYLGGIPELVLPKEKGYRTHSWFVYVVRVLNGKRNGLMEYLDKNGIQSRPYFPSIHLQPFMVEKYGYKKGDFPVSERISDETLALPFYVGLKKADVKYVSDAIKSFLK